ncbi:hypothetical protein DFH06DRAFT_1242352 [Mycena polygramma]|nr:hypothetical protein DFH06DRAFT_1242352 [Mycena polygramma]
MSPRWRAVLFLFSCTGVLLSLPRSSIPYAHASVFPSPWSPCIFFNLSSTRLAIRLLAGPLFGLSANLSLPFHLDQANISRRKGTLRKT